jgi:DNA-3-methyladenine glycosylase
MPSNTKKVPLSFFNRPALVVAKELLGCYLITSNADLSHHSDAEADGIARYMITETEAYVGPHDLASHSSKGRTKRTEVMYQVPGTIYVYLIYGMYNMLNIVTDKKDYPAAILIRAVEHNSMPITGPGKVAKQLHIDRMMNNKLLGKEANLWVELPTEAAKRKIIKTPRIGIAYAGPIWANKQYRFLFEK